VWLNIHVLLLYSHVLWIVLQSAATASCNSELQQRAATAAGAAASKGSSTPVSTTTATSQARSAQIKDRASSKGPQ